MKLFDTHMHIADERFDEDRADVISRMHAAGIVLSVIVADGTQSPAPSFDIARANPFIYAATGVHPHDAEKYTPEIEAQLIRDLQFEKCVALGEIGLDYHYDLSPREIQKQVFDRQLTLAHDLNMPVILHIREAHGDATEILLRHEKEGTLPRGIMHCYTGSWESAKQYLRMGLYISFSGSVTFKNAPKLTETASQMPLERMLVETDCPYMAPVPMRGRRNEPAYVEYTLRKIAELRGMDAKELAEITLANGREIFSLKDA